MRSKKKTLTKNTHNFFSFDYSASFFPQQQDTARTPTCTSTGWATSRSLCRDEGGKRGKRESVFFSQTSFFVFFFCRLVSLGFTGKNFQSLVFFFLPSSMRVCVCVLAPFVLSVVPHTAARARARFNFVPSFNFSVFPFDPGRQR